MVSEECFVCHRISPQYIFKYLHRLLDGRVDRDFIHIIGGVCCEIINYVDGVDRLFFCGKSKHPIVASLFYLVCNQVGVRVTQRDVCVVFPLGRDCTGYSGGYNGVGYMSVDHCTENSLRVSMKRWKKFHGDLFGDWDRYGRF